ncbi:recombinase family protein [Peribacillus butanolivorans]|uniref:Recombinase family protein n=1 Tax=Peribacillus butanolivorans TaxID=421767 RepID=A0ABM6XP96_9BACI|nr:recombinase family protein [Peribacillus butanolivorans]AXN39797.1 recombinase family protein [Peribacillus butanolivorans]
MSRPTELNIYLYLRKSRKDIEEEKKAQGSGETYDTLQRHRQTLFAVAKKERHNIVAIYEEVVSGESVTERPRIQEMLRSVEAGSVDAVLVMDLDRLGRGDMLDQGLLDRAFRYSATKILTPTESYDPSSETWELVFGIKSLVAREELKAITRRMQRGRVASASEGKSISKIPPYGYLRDENLRLYPDVDTAWVVKKMFEMMRDGHGRQAIAQELDRLGIKPPNKRRETWSPSSITAIIKNEVYIGTIIWGQVKYVKQNGKYQKKKVPRENWTIKENAHEPIVSPELFEAANLAHSGRWRPSTVTTKKLRNPMAGVLKCAVCGYSMLYQPRPKRPNDVVRCVQPGCKGVQKGSSINIVESYLLDGLAKIAEQLEAQAEAEVPSNVDDISYKRLLIEKKTQEVSELDTQKSRLHDFLERGVYDIDTFMERQKNLTDRIDGVETEIRNLQREIQKDDLRNRSVDEYLPKLRDVINAYHRADIERKNALLKSVLESVTYLRKKEWTKQDEFVLQFNPIVWPDEVGPS